MLSGAGPVPGLKRMALSAALAVVSLAANSLQATPTVTTISGGIQLGSGAGYKDGPMLYALYRTPLGIAVDEGNDTLYVADRDNNAVRMLDLSGQNTYTFTTESISAPVGVAVDGFGDVFVLNRGGTSAFNTNGTVLEFDYLSDLITTNASHLTNAMGMALDQFGNIYVTEDTNLVVRISGAIQTTVATVTASNSLLSGITVMPNGNLAVCDFNRNGIYTINPNTSQVTTNAGFNGAGDGTGINNRGVLNSKVQFNEPYGVAASGDGSLVVCDYGNHKVKVVTAVGTTLVTTNFYGVTYTNWFGNEPGWQDGTVGPDVYGGVAGRFPAAITITLDGSTVYTAEDYYDNIRETTANFRAFPPIAPVGPTGLTATVITNVQTVEVVLNWNANSQASGVTNYIVERATSPGGPFTIIASTGTATTFTDASGSPGTTYYYVIQSENAGGESPNSNQASVTIPVPPPPPPVIGWYDFEGTVQTGFFSTIHAVTVGNPLTAHNPVLLAVSPATNINTVSTFYLTVPPFTNNTPAGIVATNGSTPPVYQDNQLFGSPNVNPLPALPLSNGVVTIEAVNKNGGGLSSVTAAQIVYQIGTPQVISPNQNAANFQVTDVTTNVVFFYTLDGSDPSNAPPSQQVISTNGSATLSLDGNTNIFFQVRGYGFGPTAGYQPSGTAQAFFSPNTFVPNTLSWGFASGEGSSKYIGAAGQTFIAPVTLTTLPGTTIYSLQFNMTVNNAGAGVTNPAPAAGPFSFESRLMQPTQPPPGSSGGVFLEEIPPLVWAGFATNLVTSQTTNYDGIPFVSLSIPIGNQLSVGWAERFTFTNLYNTEAQTLITYSLAHDDLFPNAAEGEPNGVIVGEYRFQLSPAAVNGQQYQLTLNRASATSDGIGTPGSAVDIATPSATNATAQGVGSLNGIKIITVGSVPYLVGNVYPFNWFNAGDFGNSNLQSGDIEQVFESAAYGLNTPPVDKSSLNSIGGYTNVCDMYDAEDSCGQLGAMDNNISDPLFGYITNAGATLTVAQKAQMFSGNYSLVNQMAFGDGKLDISDVYITFLRSTQTNSFLWFQRFWTNGVRVATAQPAPGIVGNAFTPPSGGAGGGKGGYTPDSITNTPFANFTTTDYLASAGQTLSIPINATVFGPYAMTMLMLSVTVVPLDGSPALTVPVQFTPSAALGTAFGSTTPNYASSTGIGNYSATWLPNFPITVPGFTNGMNLGTLTCKIPTNATSASAYAIHFDTASGSPSGIICYPYRAFTGLITLSSRTNSYYGDSIPDSWRLRYFGTIYNQLSCSNANADGTSMNNWQKYHAGLDPTDPTSVLNEGLDQDVAQTPSDVVFYWPSVSGKKYIIQRSSSLFPPQWTSISTNIGNGSYMEIHDNANNGAGYYQVTTQ